ncbi:MAG: hypothetical protein LBU27_07715 [Candidatus Peribacteria bacterium]|jgi:hypothetical protein|nr:hypothetical protein [Candidatus Peribacteria bacterium]
MKKSRFYQIVKVYAPRDEKDNVAQINLTCATPKHPDRTKYVKFRPTELTELLDGQPERTKPDLGLTNCRIQIDEEYSFVENSVVPESVKSFS